MFSREFVLEVRNFRVISDAKIDLSRRKVILYGPNAGGKSTVIYSLLNLAGVGVHDDELEGEIKISHGEDFLMIYRKDREIYLDAKIGGYKVNERLRDSPEALDAIRTFWDQLGIKRVAHIDRDKLLIYDLTRASEQPPLDIDNKDDWERIMSDPEKVFSRIDEETLYNYISDVLSDEVIDIYVQPRLRSSNKWIDWTSLAYGYRRSVAIMISLLADVVMIEGFDNGLHIDLMFKILSIFDKINKLVMIETHSGSVLSKAIKSLWSVYYLERGKIRRVTEEDLQSIDLFKRELEAYKIYA